MSNYLMHHGIKGMRWGVRRYQNEDGSLKSAGERRYSNLSPNYSRQQAVRDAKVYGRLGMRRINKNVDDVGVSGARSIEARRINRARGVAQVGRNIGSYAGGAAAAIATPKLVSFVNKKYNTNIDMSDPIVRITVTGGVSYVGGLLGKYSGQSIGMLSFGYSPDKYRPAI